jgi:16S rRNA (guanine527-N7)-methyltransferase
VSTRAPFEEELSRALAGVPVPRIPPEAIEAMAALDRMLVRWSEKLDLVGFRSPAERVRRYFAEPLAAIPWLENGGPEALDIGSGGGSPALPLALCHRRKRWTLLESRRRKALFLEEAARALGLDNVAVRSERFTRCAEEGAFDLITTRGVRLSPGALAEVTRCLGPGGRLLWFSGEARLREAALSLSRRAGLRARGPSRLLPGGDARLLVVEREPFPGECST